MTPLFISGGYVLGMAGHHSKMNALETLFLSLSHSASYKVDRLMADTSEVTKKGEEPILWKYMSMRTCHAYTVHFRWSLRRFVWKGFDSLYVEHL